MQNKRVIILIVAIAAAALAILFMVSYLNSADERAQGDAVRVEVFIAKAPIPKATGMSAEQVDALVNATTAPQDIVPPSRLPSLDIIQGQIALFDIPAGVILTTEMFGDPANAENVTRTGFIPDAGLTAITVSVDQVKAVAGNLNPGDYVNIMIPITAEGPLAAELTSRGATTLTGYMTIYQKAQILAIGQSYSVSAEQVQAGTAVGASSSLMTFAVTPEAAMRIANHADSLYLTSVRPDYQPIPLPVIPSVETGEIYLGPPTNLVPNADQWPGRVPAAA